MSGSSPRVAGGLWDRTRVRRTRVRAAGSRDAAGLANMSEAIHHRPRGFRENADGSLVCRHRDLSCCDRCAEAHAERVVEVYDRHFWTWTDVEREALGEFARRFLPRGGTLH